MKYSVKVFQGMSRSEFVFEGMDSAEAFISALFSSLHTDRAELHAGEGASSYPISAFTRTPKCERCERCGRSKGEDAGDCYNSTTCDDNLTSQIEEALDAGEIEEARDLLHRLQRKKA